MWVIRGVTGRALHVERLKPTIFVTLNAVYLTVEPLEREAALGVVVELEVFKVSLLMTTRAAALSKLTSVDVLMAPYAVTRWGEPLLP